MSRYPASKKPGILGDMTMDKLNYFAYGSNMCTSRLRALDRAPSAKSVGIGFLEGYLLKFHKVSSTDGSGKCNAFQTGHKSDRVYGVVFKIEPGEKASLDQAEGLGCGYQIIETHIQMKNFSCICFLYIAEHTCIESGAKPFSWYKEFVLAGAGEHGLPEFYIREIKSAPDIQDPDFKRDRFNRAILLDYPED